MAVKTTKIQCNQDVDLRGKADIEGKVTCGGDAEIDGNLIVNSATNIKDKSLTSADAGKVLTVNEDGSLSWQQKGAGGGMKAYFDAGGKIAGDMASINNIVSFSDTSDIISMTNMFSNANKLEEIPLLDTSKVLYMLETFQSCYKITTVPLFNTSNVVSMGRMFKYCDKLVSVPLFDTSKVTYMYEMFLNCRALKSIPAFNVTNVNDMQYMLSNCENIETIHMRNIGADLTISSSTKFTREALLEIIGNLKTVTSTKTLRMGTTNLAKLTEEDKAIATNKGWTLA